MCIFFFKQKTADEMRISDWSSDVCSSDLPHVLPAEDAGGQLPERVGHEGARDGGLDLAARAIVEHRGRRLDGGTGVRSGACRVGKACASTLRSRWLPHP